MKKFKVINMTKKIEFLNDELNLMYNTFGSLKDSEHIGIKIKLEYKKLTELQYKWLTTYINVNFWVINNEENNDFDIKYATCFDRNELLDLLELIDNFKFNVEISPVVIKLTEIQEKSYRNKVSRLLST